MSINTGYEKQKEEEEPDISGVLFVLSFRAFFNLPKYFNH